MEQGYGTGMSSRPVDFASAGLSFFNSAIQARKQEIKNHMIEATENQKKILDALDVKKLGEVSYEVRDRFDKQIGDFRNQIVDLYKSKQGRLSSSDLVKIESGAMDLHNQIADAKNHLEKYNKVQSMFADPKFRDSLDNPESALLDLHGVMSNIQKGSGDMDAFSAVTKHFVPPTVDQIIANKYAPQLSKIDHDVTTTVKGRTATTSDLANLDSVNTLVNAWANDPQVAQHFPLINPATGKQAVDENGTPLTDRDAMIEKARSFVPEKFTTRPASKSELGIFGSGESKSVVNLTPTTKTIEGTEYKDIYPVDVKLSTIVAVDGTKALGTNEDVSSSITRVAPIAISPSGKFAIGVVEPDGRPHPIVNKDLNVIYNIGSTKKPKEAVLDDVKKNAQEAYERAGGVVPSGYDENRNVKFNVVKNEETGALEISGTMEGVSKRSALNPKRLVSGSEKVEKVELPKVTLPPMTSSTSKWYVKVPISEANMSDFSAVWKKYKFVGQKSGEATSGNADNPMAKILNK